MKSALRILAVLAVAMVVMVPVGRVLGLSADAAMAIAGGVTGALTAGSFPLPKRLQPE